EIAPSARKKRDRHDLSRGEDRDCREDRPESAEDATVTIFGRGEENATVAKIAPRNRKPRLSRRSLRERENRDCRETRSGTANTATVAISVMAKNATVAKIARRARKTRQSRSS